METDGQIYHARLHTNRTSFHPHLFAKSIIDSPLCLCGVIEDAYHFLFNCNHYNNLRQVLYEKKYPICRSTLNTLLHGHQDLTAVENKLIFLALHEFILKSKRFKEISKEF